MSPNSFSNYYDNPITGNETITYVGASSIELKISGDIYSSTNVSTYFRMWSGMLEDKPATNDGMIYYMTKNTNGLSSTTKTITGDTITYEYQLGPNNNQYFYFELVPYDSDGNVLQRDVETTTLIKVKNDFKPAEMANAIVSLGSTEELVYTNISYSSSTSTMLNFSSYVKDYNNIRFIVWSGTSSGTTMIYDHTVYLANKEAGNLMPHRIMSYGKASSGYTMNSLTSGAPTETRYYYFKTTEWDNNGSLSVYLDTNGDGASDSTSTYARYGSNIYLVYKKEDTE